MSVQITYMQLFTSICYHIRDDSAQLIANLNRHEDQLSTCLYSTYDSGPYMTTSSIGPSSTDQL